MYIYLFIYLFLAKRGRRPRVAGFIILSLKGLRRDEISCGVYGHVYLFIYLFIPREAGFIILSLKGLRRDEISCGVYGHVYLFIYLFIPREARPKASRSGVYNFVPQRAQAG